MSTSEKLTRGSAFIDFVPAELRMNKIWVIEYFVKNPFTNQLERKRNRVKPLKSITARKKLAKQMVHNINQKLTTGWNPFITEGNFRHFEKAISLLNSFLNKCELDLKRSNLSKLTHKSYKSHINIFINYLNDNNYNDLFIIDLNSNIIRDFLDLKFYQDNCSGRTRNNYLNTLNTFCNFLIKRKYITENPCQYIEKVKESEKQRVYIQPEYREQIFEYYKNNNENYLTLCMMCYYCFIRRTELSKLKVKDVFLKNQIIYIESGISKNSKSQPVTIPDQAIPYIKKHIKDANSEHYIFGDDNFAPGKNPTKPGRISDNWYRMKQKL